MRIITHEILLFFNSLKKQASVALILLETDLRNLTYFNFQSLLALMKCLKMKIHCLLFLTLKI